MMTCPIKRDKNTVTIFHYHLLPGGVTNVILLSIKSLILYMQKIEVIEIICGKAENTEIIKNKISDSIKKAGRKITFKIYIEPEINYLTCKAKLSKDSISTLAAHLLNKYRDSFWWIHNYQLGKNPLFTAAILEISGKHPKQRILFHIHDFPECGRYNNFENLIKAGITNPYPDAQNICYAVINSRDKTLLEKAGLSKDKIFLLNNPVEDDDIDSLSLTASEKNMLMVEFFKYFKKDFPAINPEGKIIFYPVRTIRRKNILEAGAIAAISEVPVNLVVSLPGVSQSEQKYSNLCCQCFKDGLIPGAWGTGTVENPKLPTYPQMLKMCDIIISSSVQEGFGYLFINSVKLGVPLIARYLDILNGIIDFFPNQGCSFYKELRVPLTRVQANKVRNTYRQKLNRIEKYLSAESSKKLKSDAAQLGIDESIDFSFLDIETQLNILKLVSDSTELKKEIHQLNIGLMNALYKNLSMQKSQVTDLSMFSLGNHAKSIERIINREYTWGIKSKEKTDVQQVLIDSFAELKYLRLLYDY